MSHIVVVGSFDTKSEPLNLLTKSIAALGGRPIVIDTSVFPSNAAVDVSAEQVASEAGSEHSGLPALGRAVAVHVMAEGTARVVARLVSDGDVGAVIALGGSNAATVFSKLTQVIPTGIPKIIMSTVIAGDTRPIIDATDAIMLYPIVDIEGSNPVLDAMIERLAAVAIAAAAAPRLDADRSGATSIGVTMFGVTTAAVSQSRALLEERGLQVYAFHANGSGGRSLERFVGEGLVSSVLDLTTTELADELFGGMFPAGPSRMTAAARRGIPQVISIGAIDMINFGPLHTVPEMFRHRKLLPHNDIVTLVRTTPAENELIGRTMAERLGHCTAPTEVIVPMRGVSQLDIAGGPFFDPSATAAFLRGLRAHLDASVRVIEADLHINDPAFAELLVQHVVAGRQESAFVPERLTAN